MGDVAPGGALFARMNRALRSQHGVELTLSYQKVPALWYAAADTGIGLLAQAEGLTEIEALERLAANLKTNGYALELDTPVVPPHQPS